MSGMHACCTTSALEKAYPAGRDKYDLSHTPIQGAERGGLSGGTGFGGVVLRTQQVQQRCG